MVWMRHSETGGPQPVRSGYSDYVRSELVRRLRRELAAGVYDPPVAELVDRLVDAVIARHAPVSPGQSD